MTEQERLDKAINGLEQFIADFMPFCGNKADWQRVYDALALLKEQEAVKPKSKTRHGSTTMVQHWCGNCMVMLHGKPKHCPNCGRSVKWE